VIPIVSATDMLTDNSSILSKEKKALPSLATFTLTQKQANVRILYMKNFTMKVE